MENSVFIIYGGGFEWMSACYREVFDKENVLFVNKQIPFVKKGLGLLFAKVCYGLKKRAHTYFFPFFRRVLFKSFAQKKFSKKASTIFFIIYDQNRLDADFGFVKYLRRTYKEKIKLIYCFTNTFSRSHIQNNYSKGMILKKYYDLIFSYNLDDCEKYGFCYYPLIYSRVADISKEEDKEYDCSFVGLAKERSELIHSVYKRLTSLGFKCKFYIVDLPKGEERISTNDIIYNQRISYLENIELIRKSRCVLDVSQEGASGMNLRILESLFNGTKVITNNKRLDNKNEAIRVNTLVFSDVSDIDLDFFKTPYNNSYEKDLMVFSPISFLDYIKFLLKDESTK